MYLMKEEQPIEVITNEIKEPSGIKNRAVKKEAGGAVMASGSKEETLEKTSSRVDSLFHQRAIQLHDRKYQARQQKLFNFSTRYVYITCSSHYIK
jgi:hypothetical protein